MGTRDHVSGTRLMAILRVVLLMVIPAAILVYFLFSGAFDFKKPLVTDKPSLQDEFPLEQINIPPDPVVSPSGVEDKIHKETHLEQKTMVEEAPTGMIEIPPSSPPMEPAEDALADQTSSKTADILSDLSALEEKGDVFAKKILPPYPPKKKPRKSLDEKQGARGSKKEITASHSPYLESEFPAIPRTAPHSSQGATLKIPEPAPSPKLLEKTQAAPERKPVAGKATPQLKSAEKTIAELPITEFPQSSVKPSKERLPEKNQEIARREVLNKASEIKGIESKGLSVEVQNRERKVASISSSPLSVPSSGLKPEIFRNDEKSNEDVFQDSGFYFNRGIFFQRAGDWEKALENYIQAENLDPNNPDTYNNKGVIFKELGKYDKAIDEFLRAIYLDPRYAKAYNNIGVVYFMQENYPQAVRNYLQAVELNPNNLEAFNNLAIIYKKQKDLEKARAVLNRALSMNPDHPGTNYNLAIFYEESRDFTPALHYYRRFIELGTIGYPTLVRQVKQHVETLRPQ